ncbi:hypothetical protein K501DRAFT_123805, partial [Backusella circina FSU 941]
LLIQNLDSKITEQILSGILSLIAPVINIKVFPDIQNDDIKYAHVEFHGHREAEQVLHAMDGRIIYSKKIKVSWNKQEEGVENIDIFISNLDPQVDNIILAEAFKVFYPSTARVVRNDDFSKLSNGIISFSSRDLAESAIQEMNGKTILSYAIKCCWDSEDLDKNGNYINSKRPSTLLLANMSYEEIFAQAPLYNTSISIGNLPEQIIKQDLAPYLQQYSYVSEIHLEAEKGTAIAKLDTHANAATAIFALQGINIGGKAVQFSWAKGR